MLLDRIGRRGAAIAGAMALFGFVAAQARAQTILPDGDGVVRIVVPDPLPATLCRGAVESMQHMLLIRERQALLLAEDLRVDVALPGTYGGNPPGGAAGWIHAGAEVDCYILHQDSPGMQTVELEGGLIFAEEVLGILVRTPRLRDTDALLGHPAILYPHPSVCDQLFPHQDRGLEGVDRVTLHPDRRRVDVSFRTRGNVDEIRVLTRPSVTRVLPYCEGSSGCPCGNDSPVGAGRGCVSSTQQGARLSSFGEPAVVAQPDFSLLLEDVPAGTYGIVFMGTHAVPPLPFGDGLLCVQPGPPGNPPGTGFLRFPVRQANAAGSIVEPDVIGHANASFPPHGIIAPGSTWHFQGYYRDPWMQTCQQSYFNLTNALEVSFH